MPPLPSRRSTDFIVVGLRVAIPTGSDLRVVARRYGFRGLLTFLEQHRQIRTARVVVSVPPARLLALEKRASVTELPPTRSLTSYWYLDCSALRAQIPQFVRRLRSLEEVADAYRQPAVRAPWTPTGTNPMRPSQGYLAAAPEGINAAAAWTVTDGSGVGFADLEKAWCAGHRDLYPAGAPACGTTGTRLNAAATAIGVTVIAGNNDPLCNGGDATHGTAVLGIVLGADNGLGVVGIAPGAGPVRLACRFRAAPVAANPCDGTDHWVANAIAAALADLRVGDVLLLEVEVATTVTATSAATWGPAECDPTAFLAARLASALGVIVVAAAGNGGKSLKDLAPITGAVPPFGPAAPLSGAIVVGSAEKAVTTLSSGVPTHKRWSTSNHGARVDCYAWGEQVATLGHRGEVDANGAAMGFPPADGTQWYTKSFGATSAAAAIVAGAALLTQAAYKSGGGGRVLSPAAMRALLRGYGTACYDAVNENIGCMPDLAKVMTEIGRVPDLYIRDNPTDGGAVPSTGDLSVSPDVVVRPTLETTSVAFATGGSQVLVGQTNYVYVRVSNRNSVAAQNAVVKVYWAPVSTLLTPSSWKQIPNTASVNLMGPAALVAAPAITWDTNLPPATGHYCFIATVNHPADPQPVDPSDPIDPAVAWSNFLSYIRNNNNVTWRNFDVVTAISGSQSAPQPNFIVAGAPDAARIFDLELTRRPPRGVQIAWEMPLALLTALGGPKHFVEVKIDERKRRAVALLPNVARLPLPRVRLAKNARHACRLVIATAHAKPAQQTLAIRQLFHGREVGRVTWDIRVRAPHG